MSKHFLDLFLLFDDYDIETDDIHFTKNSQLDIDREVVKGIFIDEMKIRYSERVREICPEANFKFLSDIYFDLKMDKVGLI